MSFNILKDVKRSMVHFTIKGQTIKKLDVYDREIFKGQIDACKASQGIVGNFITKMLTDNLGNHSNFKFMCPTKAGFYYFSNFPTLNENSLPPFMPKDLYGKFMIFSRVQGKMADNKPFVILISVSTYGELIKG